MELSVLVSGSGFPRLRSSVTLVASRGLRILVDSGDLAQARPLLCALSANGLAPEDVDIVVATHLHYDHCGNHLLFARARWLVSAVDFADTRTLLETYAADPSPKKAAVAALLESKNAAIKDFYVRAIVREVERNRGFYDRVLAGDSRFELLQGPLALTDEVEVLETPGHTPGHLSVLARGAAPAAPGAPRGDVLVAGDAVIAAPAAQEPDELHLAADVEQFRSTRAALLERFAHVVPGHGPAFAQARVEAAA